MMSRFSAMQVIAAQRGDGLCPELVELLKRSRAQAELGAKSSFPLCDYQAPIASTGADENAVNDSADVPR
jgi:hypothetical protein